MFFLSSIKMVINLLTQTPSTECCLSPHCLPTTYFNLIHQSIHKPTTRIFHSVYQPKVSKNLSISSMNYFTTSSILYGFKILITLQGAQSLSTGAIKLTVQNRCQLPYKFTTQFRLKISPYFFGFLSACYARRLPPKFYVLYAQPVAGSHVALSFTSALAVFLGAEDQRKNKTNTNIYIPTIHSSITFSLFKHVIVDIMIIFI